MSPNLRRGLLATATLLLVGGRARAQSEPQKLIEPLEELVFVTRDGARHVFRIEVARTSEQQQVGLMFRPVLEPDRGMLFDWGRPIESTMWMRNTPASLDMVFLRADGVVHRIAERTVPFSLSTIASNGPVRATLELGAGTAARIGLRPGDRALHPIFGG